MKNIILVTALVLTAIAVFAQYSINWSTIDGGGKTMSGGDFMMRGTIGQADAGNMDGGNFVIRGGFWVPQAVQVAGGPRLSIAVDGGTDVVISWTPDVPGWVLQETFSLQTNWVDSASGSLNPVTIPATEAAQFYRLRQE